MDQGIYFKYINRDQKRIMIAYLILTDTRKQQILTNVANELGINEQVVEKDVWVTMVIEALFTVNDIGQYLVFKGGTSLSKGYDLIARFSEDIDFAIDRKILGFTNEQLTNSQIKKLRKASNLFIREQLIPKLNARMIEMGVPAEQFNIDHEEVRDDDADPLPIRVHFHSVVNRSSYLAEQVLIEISARSLMEPSESVEIKSLIAKIYPNEAFAGRSFNIAAVWPGRTFLEKLFLLHEQFAQNEIQPPRNRMSRHLYDVEKLMDTDYAIKALQNRELYEDIVRHRSTMTPIRGLSYESHGLETINFIPPDQLAAIWKEDYQAFIANMVIGNKLTYEDLIGRLTQLLNRMREIKKSDNN